jgi:putative hydrolase of the HAD superfamily
VCDNDGTLYACERSLEKEVTGRMIDFIARDRGVCREQAVVLRQGLLRRYRANSTVVALQREGRVDIERLIEETYLAVPLCDFGLTRSEPLFDLLACAPGQKLVLTNGPEKFARSILAFLGRADLFERILGIEQMGFVEKPDPRAFQVLQPYLAAGKRVVLIDDSAANLVAVEQMGCTGILWDRTNQEMRRLT